MQQILWGFPMPQEVGVRTLEVFDRVERGDNALKADNRAMAEAVNRLVHEGLQAYYHEPARLVGLSPAMRATGDHSIRIVAGAMRLVVNRFFSGLSRQELVAVAAYMRELVVEPPQRDRPHLMFPLEQASGETLLASLEQVKTGGVSHHDVRTLTHQLQQVVDVCLVHYYRKPADMVSLGKLTRKAADTGIHTVQRAFHTLLGRLLPNLREPALARLSDHLATLVHIRPSE